MEKQTDLPFEVVDKFKDLFDDLAKKQEVELLSLRLKNTRNDLAPPPLQTSSFSTQQLDTTPPQELKSDANAILNQQFFVWKNGEAGRLSVDTPFGFKAI